MTDLPILAAALLANFATICIPRCERLWTWPVANPPPKLREKFLSTAIAGERLIIGYHREYLRYRLLERGHHAFLDRLEGGGSEGWHLHFFCLDPAAVAVLQDIGLGECGPGDAQNFDPRTFVAHRLSLLDRMGRLDRPSEWWLVDWLLE